MSNYWYFMFLVHYRMIETKQVCGMPAALHGWSQQVFRFFYFFRLSHQYSAYWEHIVKRTKKTSFYLEYFPFVTPGNHALRFSCNMQKSAISSNKDIC